MPTVDWPKCEICGEKAALVIRDLIRADAPDGSCRFSHKGEWHYYCAEHDREGRAAWERSSRADKLCDVCGKRAVVVARCVIKREPFPWEPQSWVGEQSTECHLWCNEHAVTIVLGPTVVTKGAIE